MTGRGKSYSIDGTTVVVSYLPRRGSCPAQVRVARHDGRFIGYWDLERCRPVAEDPGRIALVRKAASAWERDRPDERDLFRAAPARRPAAGGTSSWVSSAPTRTRTPGPPSRATTTSLDPHPAQDLARNRPAQQLVLWRRDYLRRYPLRVLKGFFDGVGDEEYRRKTQGIRGERAVARELRAFLGRHPQWRVLHSIVVSAAGTDLDHLLIGPRGVYTINTKHWSGRRITGTRDTVRTARADGSGRHGEVTTIRSARHESDRASMLLSTAVGWTVSAQPVVAFVNPAGVRDELAAHGVRLLALDTFQSWFDAEDARPTSLSAEQVATVYRAARHPATWLPRRSRSTA